MNTMTLWLTPLVLLPGVALLIVSTSARYDRLHDEVHHLAEHRAAPLAAGVVQHLADRTRRLHHALVSLYGCVGLFALASLLGMLTSLWGEVAAWTVLPLTAAGIFSLAYAAAQLIRESVLSAEIIDAHRRALTGCGTQVR